MHPVYTAHMGNGAGTGVGAEGSRRARRTRWLPRVSDLEFKGCDAFPATEADMDRPEWWKRRFEYWNRELETVWIARDESPIHARTPHSLTRFLERVALVRGSPIETMGSAGLRMSADGALGGIMQPDLVVWVHPRRSRLPEGRTIVHGRHDWPDVVLEVDHSTDVRRGKLAVYEAWGLPELWVEVPDKSTPGRPRGLRPGMTMHRLEFGRYREVGESVAIPDLHDWEVHAVVNDMDGEFIGKLARRLGGRLGAAEGTTVENDPIGGWVARTRREEGRKEGRREEAGRSRVRWAGEILRNRGVALSPDFPGCLPGVAEALAVLDESRIVAAALVATDEVDFGARLLGVGSS